MSRKYAVGLLFLFGFLIYLSSFWNKFVWDDEQFIYRNQYVQTFDLSKILTENTIAGAGEISNYYRPLTTLTFAIDHALWGLTPFGFHVTNVTLHSLAGVTLFLLLSALTRNPKHHSYFVVIAAIFLVHPLQTEAVTYVNSRGDSLFALLSLLCLLSFVLSWFAAPLKLSFSSLSLTLSKTHLLVLSIFFYALALTAKEISIVTPGVAIALTGATLLREKVSLKKSWQLYKAQWLTLISMLLVGTGYMALRATVLNFSNSFNFYAAENEYASNLAIRLLTFSKVLWVYISLLLFPHPLHMERETELVTSFFSIWPYATIILVITLLVLGWWEFKHKDSTWIWLGSSWFALFLLPVSGIIPINGVLYEHWLYMPLIGFCITFLGIYALCQKYIPTLIKKNSFYIWVTLLCIYSVLTMRQNYLWRSPIAFYEYTLQFSQSARLHNNLAMAYDEQGNVNLALTHYQKALDFDDNYYQIHYNMGNAYASQQKFTEAEAAYKKALAINPYFLNTYGSLVNLYLAQQRFPEALTLITELEKQQPNDPELKRVKAFIITQLKPAVTP